METLVLTNELVRRIEQSEAEYMESRLKNLKAQVGDSSGIHIARFGNAIAFLTRSLLGNPDFNRVIGLTAQDKGLIKPILEFYSRNGVPCRIDLNPYNADRDFLVFLAEHSFHQSRYETVLYGVPPVTSPLPQQHIVVREVHQEELDLYAEVCEKSFQDYLSGSDAEAKLYGKYAKNLFGIPGWSLYLAFIDEVAAAAALLYIERKVGSLVVGTTLPKFRNQGCQKALIQRRMVDAISKGCTLIVSQTRVGSVSQNNMEKSGLRIAYTKAVYAYK